MTRPRGFTLVEVVVVLTLLAIVAAVAVPIFRDSDIQKAWYHEQLKAAFRYAQRQAVAQRKTIHVDVQATQVRLCYNAPPGCIPLLTNTADGLDYVLPAPTGVTLSPQSFFFNGLGQPSGLVSLNVAGQTITVNAETGYVQ